jgi:hypothetical protein
MCLKFHAINSQNSSSFNLSKSNPSKLCTTLKEYGSDEMKNLCGKIIINDLFRQGSVVVYE